MFTQISWNAYLQTVFILLGIYYVVVFFKFYRHDFLMLVKRRRFSPSGAINGSASETASQLGLFSDASNAISSTATGHHPVLQSFLSEIEAFLLQAGENAFDKEQILSSLAILIERHPVRHSTADQQMVNDAIVRFSQEHSSIFLSAQEVEALWQ